MPEDVVKVRDMKKIRKKIITVRKKNKKKKGRKGERSEGKE